MTDRKTMWAKVIVDEFDGQIAWECTTEGDREGPEKFGVVKLVSSEFPLGTRLDIYEPEYPMQEMISQDPATVMQVAAIISERETNVLNTGVNVETPSTGDGVALLSAKIFDFLGDQANLTNEKVARFMTNAIAMNVITALIADLYVDPDDQQRAHQCVHDAVKETIKYLSTADVRLG
jgi:hypothetical protein